MKLPKGIKTCKDGRKPVYELYNSFLKLKDRGWIFEVICLSKPDTSKSLPIISLRTKKKGKAIWILSGVHGEEPAGPNAISDCIDVIMELGGKIPVVLIPLCNPWGYVRNWRYLNMKKYSEVEGKSVADSEHCLLDKTNPKKPQRSSSSSKEARALTSYVLKMSKIYPPKMSFDLHEDNLSEKGYIYFNGDKKIARKIINILLKSKISVQMNGRTRFNEPIHNGLVIQGEDDSIDELIGSKKIIVKGRIVKGPSAKTVVVFETPAKNMSLAKRKHAHVELLHNIGIDIDRINK